MSGALPHVRLVTLYRLAGGRCLGGLLRSALYSALRTLNRGSAASCCRTGSLRGLTGTAASAPASVRRCLSLELPAGHDGHRRGIRRGGFPTRKALTPAGLSSTVRPCQRGALAGSIGPTRVR